MTSSARVYLPAEIVELLCKLQAAAAAKLQRKVPLARVHRAALCAGLGSMTEAELLDFIAEDVVRHGYPRGRPRNPAAAAAAERPVAECDGGGPELEVALEREDDGRWIAEVESLPGVLGYGSTREEARAACLALAERVIAERGSAHESS